MSKEETPKPASTCAICKQEMRPGLPALAEVASVVDGHECDDDCRDLPHHLDRCPYDRSICLGCSQGALDLEQWLLRSQAGRGIFWSHEVQDLMREVLARIAAGHRLGEKWLVEAVEIKVINRLAREKANR